jgi:hypothetical protein
LRVSRLCPCQLFNRVSAVNMFIGVVSVAISILPVALLDLVLKTTEDSRQILS